MPEAPAPESPPPLPGGSAADLAALRAELAELREREAQLRRLVENLPEVAWTADERGDAVFVSANIAALYGFTPEEVYRQGAALWMGRIHPDDRPAVERAWRDLFAHGRRFDIEYRIRHRDGRWVWWYDRAEKVYERGGRRLADGVLSDITERRALEDQLRQAQKMEALGQLVGGIAHDLNNVLTAVMAHIELARGAPGGVADEVRQELTEAWTMARRGADMIRKLLAFGRHEHLEMEGVALEPVVRDAVELMRHMLPEHIELALTSSLPAGTVVRADPSAVQQMLINLATNAQDAMPSGGRLSLDLSLGDVDEARVATHGWGAPGVHVCLRVSDSGAGMAPDVLARATEPFFTTRSGGAGLGLTMVYGLMKHHGGFLELASEPGRGTTARLCFPRTDGRPAPATTAPAAGGGETILLVEDEVSIRRAARRVLERFGYRVVTAADGEEGLARWREQRGAIDLVVSDAIMPRMGGGALYERLRAEDPAVRFLLCSGYTGQQLRGAGEEGGAAVPFLAKPWTVDDLLAAVRDALTGPTRA